MKMLLVSIFTALAVLLSFTVFADECDPLYGCPIPPEKCVEDPDSCY